MLDVGGQHLGRFRAEEKNIRQLPQSGNVFLLAGDVQHWAHQNERVLGSRECKM